MEKNKYTLNLSNIRTKIRTYQEQGKDVLFTVIFISGREKSKLIDRAPVQQLALITKNLKYENPDKVRIELYDGKDAVNPLWLKEILLASQQPAMETEPSNFKGFGEAEISRIVDERFQERQRLAEYEQLKERVLELTGENEELRDTIEQLENHSSQVETELESKKQIRYYAGMLGDILESFGIARDKVKKPLAELMGLNDTADPKTIQGKQDDRSGIVDTHESASSQSPENQKRSEIIDLVAEYLKSTSNEILGAVFSIFSEIELDNNLALEIVRFINQKKENHNGKV
jgi:TolA-binding protein